ncbi:MAG: hypothetical protein JWL96_3402 [Sphingomonas bacterium]|nr:hypothetical protein [Sphingomonas bacterium]
MFDAAQTRARWGAFAWSAENAASISLPMEQVR